MDKEIEKLLNESISLELNVAKIYENFASSYPEDKNFWWTLVIEEKNHAAILRSGEESYLKVDLFPEKILANSIEQLKSVNHHIKEMIADFSENPPDREKAFNIAYKLEKSAGEIHFQDFMTQNSDSEIDRIFKRLNQDDKDHADRILRYMEQKNIPLNEDILPEFLR